MNCPFKRTPDKYIRNVLFDWDEVEPEVALLIAEVTAAVRPIQASDGDIIRDERGWHTE